MQLYRALAHGFLLAATAAVVSSSASVAFAQAPPPAPPPAGAPKFEYSKPAEAKPTDPPWKVAVQGGLILTTGNSQTTSLAGSGTVIHRVGANKIQLDAGTAYATSDIRIAVDDNGDGFIDAGEVTRENVTTTEAWSIKARYDRFFTEHNAVFASGRLAADEPAGKELLSGVQVGYSRLLLKTAMHELAAELGYDFTYENYVVPGDAIRIHSARGYVGYTGKLSETTGFDASAEVLANLNSEDTPTGEVDPFDDTRMVAKVSLTTKLFAGFSFRFGFGAKYDQAPAPLPPFSLPYAPGFLPLADELDTSTEAVLILDLF